MRTFDELVAQLRGAEGAGFDVSATQAGEVLNRWIKRLAALSKWVKEEVELGPGVADQDVYAIPAQIVDIHSLSFAGEPALRVSRNDIFRLKIGSASLVNGPPWTAFAPAHTSSGVKEVAIYPAPTASGDSLLALCSVTPQDLSGEDVPPFPDDFEEALLHGAQATLARDLDNDPQTADYHEGKALAEAEDLRRRGNSRVGGGPFRIPVRGRW